MTDYPARTRSRELFLAHQIPAKGFFFLFIVLSVVLAACGGGNTPQTPSKGPVTLKVVSAPAQGNPDNFNPYFTTNQGGSYGSQGFLYETLYFVNAYNAKETPWLASSYEYNSDLTTLTFHLRSGVKWSDNQPFTSNDVLFTFNLMKTAPALDTNSLWPTLIKSVAAPDASTVVFTLLQPDVTALFRIGDQVFIVPEHTWKNISGDPAKFTNDSPVNTGPYTLVSHSAQLIKYTRNPNFWGTKPEVEQIMVPALTTNALGALQMAKGQLDWLGAGWAPELDPAFTGKDPVHNHHWFVPSNTVMLYLNLQKYPFNLLPVRKAISLAIDRQELQQKAAPYAPPANPTGVMLPNFKDYLTSDYASAQFSVDRAQAEKLLQGAGFKKDASGIYADKSGKEISFSLLDVNGWSDWDSDTQLIQHDLQAIGIKTSINSVGDYTPYYDALASGTYEAAISWTNGGPTPYYPYFYMLSSAKSAPAGKSITGGTNFERWSDKATDKLLLQYSTSKDANVQLQAIQGIEKIMVEQMPTIPLTYNPFWAEYTTTNLVGWPSADDPYDVASPYTTPDNENVVLHLHAA
ncbi:MAG TPA: ABC transporter substrate-binding protein [Ktedonobacteraceae bacterium]|jgi:peptide/nickel transport system substrate-binding protein|nr:ABC transporter substrate-binding protein [Ktedonobacteraceae bacterium]